MWAKAGCHLGMFFTQLAAGSLTGQALSALVTLLMQCQTTSYGVPCFMGQKAQAAMGRYCPKESVFALEDGTIRQHMKECSCERPQQQR